MTDRDATHMAIGAGIGVMWAGLMTLIYMGVGRATWWIPPVAMLTTGAALLLTPWWVVTVTPWIQRMRKP